LPAAALVHACSDASVYLHVLRLQLCAAQVDPALLKRTCCRPFPTGSSFKLLRERFIVRSGAGHMHYRSRVCANGELRSQSILTMSAMCTGVSGDGIVHTSIFWSAHLSRDHGDGPENTVPTRTWQRYDRVCSLSHAAPVLA
jgi:hypothetical protein